jgi:hypothetical protein
MSAAQFFEYHLAGIWRKGKHWVLLLFRLEGVGRIQLGGNLFLIIWGLDPNEGNVVVKRNYIRGGVVIAPVEQLGVYRSELARRWG